MKCSNCRSEIPSSQINIATDLAHCKACNTIIKISEISSTNDSFDIKKNPKGTWYKRVSSNELNLGASTRSPIAFFLVPFMLIWSGASLGGIYGTQIIKGEFDLFISLFGIPFLIGTIIFGSIAVMSVAGKIDIKLTKQGGTIFTGLGPIGFSKNFDWEEISEIKEHTQFGHKRKSTTKIRMEGTSRVSFGTGLNSSRQYYILEALKKVHFNIKNNNTLSF